MTDIQSYPKGFIFVAGSKWMGWDWGLNKKEKHPLIKAAILPLSKWGNRPVWYWTQCGWNTAAHCCISALCGNLDKSKRSSCHYYDVVRKHRNGLCCRVYVCVCTRVELLCVTETCSYELERTGQQQVQQCNFSLDTEVRFCSRPTNCSFYLKPNVPHR